MKPVKAWIPDFSEINVLNNGSLQITAPSGWVYSGYNKKHQFLNSLDASVELSSSCLDGDGCLSLKTHYKGGTVAYCDGRCKYGNVRLALARSGDSMLNGGFLDVHTEAYILETHEYLPGPFPAMFEVPEVILRIQQFLEFAFPEDKKPPTLSFIDDQVYCPAGIVLAFVNIAGRAVLLPVPEARVKANAAAGTVASCHCSSSDCSLKELTIPSIGSVGCLARECNNSCTLSTSIALGASQMVTSTVETYTY